MQQSATPKKAFMTLMDIGIKNKGRVQLFDESCLDEEGKVIPFDTQLAIVTHYLITEGSPHSKVYDKAKEWYKKGGELKEIALQAFTEKELYSLPKSWKEFCDKYRLSS